jgi:hypothetical protein
MVGDSMKKTIEKHQCKVGLHKWGNVKEVLNNGHVILARRCVICNKVKPEK